MKLIDGWKAAWRYHVVLAAAALAALNFVQAHPEVVGLVGQILPADRMKQLNELAPLAIIFLRLIAQPKATAAVQAAAAANPTAPAAPADPSKEPS